LLVAIHQPVQHGLAQVGQRSGADVAQQPGLDDLQRERAVALAGQRGGAGHERLYDLLDQKYGQRPHRARESREPVCAGVREAEALGVAEGAPLMQVERTAYARSGLPLEFARDLFRGDDRVRAQESARPRHRGRRALPRREIRAGLARPSDRARHPHTAMSVARHFTRSH